MKSLLYIGNALSIHGSNPTGIETLGPLLELEGFKLKYASSKKSKILRLIDMLFTTIKNVNKVDCVLIDTYSTQNFWYAFLISQICRLANQKYIPILHGGNLPQRIQKNPKLAALIFKNAFANVAPSKYMVHELNKVGYKNVILIPNQIDLSQYSFKERSAISPKILWVRALADIYNPRMALQALAIVQKTFPNAKLCMVGPDKGELENVRNLAKSLSVSVVFKGKLSRNEWTRLSEDYDIFINTARTDNTPVSVIEAMALGLPVISTNVGGMPFLINDGDQGLLVADDSASQMAKSILKILNNPEIGKSITLNAKKMIADFDATVVAKQWGSILK